MKSDKLYEKIINKEYNNLETPCYIIDRFKFEDNIDCMREAFKIRWENINISYSVKTNHFKTMLDYAREKGLMAEVVSKDEYAWARKCGYDAENIIVNGPQKDAGFIINVLNDGGTVNIDNLDEIAAIRSNIHKIKDISKAKLGIRINFDLEKYCNNETKTADLASRFGICLENGDVERAVCGLNEMGFSVRGLHFHYSTKTRSTKIYSTIAKKAVEIINYLKISQQIEYIDFGGGYFGGQLVPGKPTMDEYAEAICGQLENSLENNVKLIFEPGASIIATAVDYITKCIHVRDVRNQTVVTLDGSNLDINPFLYSRKPVYEILNERKGKNKKKLQIVGGSTCMEQDRFMILEDEKEIDIGDYIICHNVGAYTMCFNNGFINLPPTVYTVNRDGIFMVRTQCQDVLYNV